MGEDEKGSRRRSFVVKVFKLRRIDPKDTRHHNSASATRGETKDGLNLTSLGICRDPLRFAPRNPNLVPQSSITGSGTTDIVPIHEHSFRPKWTTSELPRLSETPGSPVTNLPEPVGPTRRTLPTAQPSIRFDSTRPSANRDPPPSNRQPRHKARSPFGLRPTSLLFGRTQPHRPRPEGVR
jgi:hypothetical protein